MVPLSNPLSGISDVFNGVLVDANMVGEVMFYGAGAGKLPTASAVVADILDIVAHLTSESVRAPRFSVAADADYADMAAYACRSCVSFANETNAEAKIAGAFGKAETVVEGGRIALVTDPMTEEELQEKIDATGLTLASRIRMLG
jgi:homoserine dehydrogenase